VETALTRGKVKEEEEERKLLLLLCLRCLKYTGASVNICVNGVSGNLASQVRKLFLIMH